MIFGLTLPPPPSLAISFRCASYATTVKFHAMHDPELIICANPSEFGSVPFLFLSRLLCFFASIARLYVSFHEDTTFPHLFVVLHTLALSLTCLRLFITLVPVRLCRFPSALMFQKCLSPSPSPHPCRMYSITRSPRSTFYRSVLIVSCMKCRAKQSTSTRVTESVPWRTLVAGI